MSHLGDLLSALVDGELSGAELDRANAHVAACGTCRVEANALRQLKHQLRSLTEVSDSGVITGRLLAVSAQADPDPLSARRLGGEGGQRYRIRTAGRRRGRYLLWSTLSLVVLGIVTAAFGMGGSPGPALPQITPQLEVFDVQHAITSGDVPFDDPADVSASVPAGAATP